MRIRIRLAMYVLALAGAAACGGTSDEHQPPVARPALTLSAARAPIGSPVRFTYRFEPTGQKIDGDYWVFLHVLDEEGERLWGDDHRPPVPTSAWKEGEPVEYTRIVFLPNYPYIGPAELRVGLYNPSTAERLALAGTEIAQREYEVASLEILPQSENVFLIYRDGWHPTEVSREDPTVEWQWTRKVATVSFRNPKKDSTFYLEYDARSDLFDSPQQVTIRIGDQVIGSVAAEGREKSLIKLPITAAQLGDADVVELTIEVDRTFTAGAEDSRELGIRVFHAFVEPN